MIEAMEQQIINSINYRWRKDKNKRSEINIDKLSECFRIICSSRNSTLSILNTIEKDGLNNTNIIKLKENLFWIYDWITKDSIESLYSRYSSSLKDKKKELKYKNELTFIKEYLDTTKKTLIDLTIKKLLEFHHIKEICNA